MLIIGREVGQAVIIGDVIKATLIYYDSKYSLVIDAPGNIPISRVKPNSALKLKKRFKIIGETVHIGDCIKVTILQTETKSVRFAIDAPKEISIFREELLLFKEMNDQKKQYIS